MLALGLLGRREGAGFARAQPVESSSPARSSVVCAEAHPLRVPRFVWSRCSSVAWRAGCRVAYHWEVGVLFCEKGFLFGGGQADLVNKMLLGICFRSPKIRLFGGVLIRHFEKLHCGSRGLRCEITLMRLFPAFLAPDKCPLQIPNCPPWKTDRFWDKLGLEVIYRLYWTTWWTCLR